MQGSESFDEFVLYGSRGHSQMFVIVLEGVWQGRVRLRAVVDDLNNGYLHPSLGVKVISGAERAAHHANLPVLLTIGNGETRAKIAARLAEEGAVLATFINRVPERVAADAKIGAGTIVDPLTRISPNVVIGAGAQILALAIGHDVTIGDFATLAAGCIINGNVQIGAGVNIGSGAVICNGTPGNPLRIGDGATIAMGAVIMRDVPPGARMMGNPAMTVREWMRLQALVRRPG
ncbi:acetyltransferase [Pseudotabrizicola sp.]|uniref:acetyltransferase n=1 Tax=Pseudotabrizicola sp. TaxID=2939647 RepID=UPI002722440B|nr:acetyltransferase [Pseudotabrizicola sp.]MDO8881589.1 acetyltransferase [Pseudotabrizicola sp.]